MPTQNSKTTKPDKYWLQKHAPIFLNGYEPLPELVTDSLLLSETTNNSDIQVQDEISPPQSIPALAPAPTIEQKQGRSIGWVIFFAFIGLIICGLFVSLVIVILL